MKKSVIFFFREFEPVFLSTIFLYLLSLSAGLNSTPDGGTEINLTPTHYLWSLPLIFLSMLASIIRFRFVYRRKEVENNVSTYFIKRYFSIWFYVYLIVTAFSSLSILSHLPFTGILSKGAIYVFIWVGVIHYTGEWAGKKIARSKQANASE